MQCACAIVSSVACPAVLYFSTLPHKRHDFRKIKLWNIKCMFWFPVRLLLEACIILSRTEQDMIEYVYWAFCKIYRNLIFFSRQIFEKCSSWKSVQWELNCAMRTDGHTDRHNEANSRFSQSCERAFKWLIIQSVFACLWFFLISDLLADAPL